MKESTNIDEFIKSFNLTDNALQLRTLRRWNGRDLRDEENLAEHTHLVVCCVYDLYDELNAIGLTTDVNIANVVKHALIHDSLELFRGDILSITKDSIPNLRKYCDDEEENFMTAICNNKLTDIENALLKLADLKACYKYIEWELRYPSNEFAKNAYISTKEKFVKSYNEFLNKFTIFKEATIEDTDFERFSKGYKDDAGVDIILDRDVTFLPMSTTTFDLNINITPCENEMSILCARTSAANKGLTVATCPIDPNYNGNVSAIVHNISNNVITYKKGESFCQYVKIKTITDSVKPRKEGKRSNSKLGGTGKC